MVPPTFCTNAKAWMSLAGQYDSVHARPIAAQTDEQDMAVLGARIHVTFDGNVGVIFMTLVLFRYG